MNQREKVMVALCGAVVLGVGGPMLLSSMGGVNGGATELKAARAKALASRKEARQLREEITSLEPQVREVAWSESPDVLYPGFATRILEMGRKANVTIPSIRAGKVRALDVVSEQPVEVNVSASFPAFVRFLYLLQDPAAKISLDRVRITGVDPESDRVSVELGVSTYTTYMVPAATGAGARATGSTGGAGAGELRE